MRHRWRGAIAVLAAVAALAACGPRAEPNLMRVGAGTTTPDEFAIVPTKPLELPEDIAALPPPTPGGTNLTDPQPEADAIAALGGRPETKVRGGIPARDSGLVSYASRFGVNSNIRAELAAEDYEFRSRNRGRVLERLFNLNTYFRAYRSQQLDQDAELERWRSAGVRTVGAPPDPREQ